MLIDFERMQTIKPVSGNNQVIFEQISTEVEELYLPQYMGASFALDIQKNPGNYTDLLEGLEFENCDGELVKFKGIYYWLAYLIYAEYSWQTKFKDTYTGFVQKNRTEAATNSQGHEKQVKANSRKIAEFQVGIMHEYLNLNSENFEFWNCSKKKKVYAPKFTSVKRTRT